MMHTIFLDNNNRVSMGEEGEKMIIEQEKSEIVIGYYPIRGKAQVPRLIC